MKDVIIQQTLINQLPNRDNHQHNLSRVWKNIVKYRWMYFMILPPLLYFAVFQYLPLWNAQIAFKDFKPLLGVWKSPFIGFDHFVTFFHSYYFKQLLSNTLIISFLKLVLGIPVALILAVGLYETCFKRFRAIVQTVAYLPHFLSWVIMFGILLMLLSPGDGLINDIIRANGGKPIAFITSPDWFRVVVIGSDIWKDMGWSTIIYLAALLGIDPTLYEVAAVDGATRLQRTWFISLPLILPVVAIITMLRLGHILNAGFNQIFILYSLPVYSVGDILDTWVYRQGILSFQFSLATAVGLFKGAIGLVLVVASNKAAKKFGGSGLY